MRGRTPPGTWRGNLEYEISGIYIGDMVRITRWFPIKRDDNVIEWTSGSMRDRDDAGGLQVGLIAHLGVEKNPTMNSTMLIPKCSSTIVLNPMLALESQSSTTAYGALMMNSTWDWTPFEQLRKQESYR